MSIQSEITRISGKVSESLSNVAAKGVAVPDGAGVNELPGLIASITGGGGGGGGGSTSEPLDPVEVYNTTRPCAWLTMSTAADKAAYKMLHSPDGVRVVLEFRG